MHIDHESICTVFYIYSKNCIPMLIDKKQKKHYHIKTNEGYYTVCVQIFAGRICCKCPAPNNCKFHDLNFVNGGLQQQICTVCVHVFTFLFSRSPIAL